jgi:hypothetical protein
MVSIAFLAVNRFLVFSWPFLSMKVRKGRQQLIYHSIWRPFFHFHYVPNIDPFIDSVLSVISLSYFFN